MTSSDYDQEFDQWEKEKVEDFKRTVIANTLKMKPGTILEIMMRFAMYRMEWYFENDKFGIVSPYQPGNSKEANLKLQYKIYDELRIQKMHPVAHIGFWEGLQTRCLFVPRIDKSTLSRYASKNGLDAFITGEKGQWKCYQVDDDMVIATGNEHKIIMPDGKFFMYCKVQLKKEQLYGSRMSNKRLFESQILDLEKLENEIIQAI